jgi:hypothetical protein
VFKDQLARQVLRGVQELQVLKEGRAHKEPKALKVLSVPKAHKVPLARKVLSVLKVVQG